MTLALSDRAVHDLVSAHQSSGRALLYAFARAHTVELRSSGSWVECANGERYLDLGSYAVFLLGHSPRRVVEAVAAQLGVLPGSTRTFPHAPGAQAAQVLASIAPESLSKVMLLNSGAEAVEAAIKLARVGTGRTLLAHLTGSFHGKTTGALSLTDSPVLRDPVGPLLPAVRLSAVDPLAAAAQIRAVRPAAVFAEPVQGEGGAVVVSDDLLWALRSACDDTGSLLVFDEIQCGLGRTGAMWAHSRAGVQPDVLLVGKALGGGVMPVSALVATPAAFAPYDRDPLLHTSTFGGNPLAAAAALAAVATIQEEGVPDRARERGESVRAILMELVAEFASLFVDVTGAGALLGLHCREAAVAGHLLRCALDRHVLLTPCLMRPTVLRFTPSAFLTAADLEFARTNLRAAALAVPPQNRS